MSFESKFNLSNEILDIMTATGNKDSIKVTIYAVKGYGFMYPLTIKSAETIDVDYEENLYDLYLYEQYAGHKDNIIYKREDSNLFWLFLDKEEICASFNSLEEIKNYLYEQSISSMRELINKSHEIKQEQEIMSTTIYLD